ncbi:PucR family transcriptional regulator [Streptomyces similanensis]|uniref:PucR family transcriptional regulator n=1 Tax=Streptomyces similanensis TaxID=1274988 RepID=UPI0031E6DB80
MAAALQSRLAELGERMALRIRASVDPYDDESLVPLDSLCRSCAANADLVLTHLSRRGVPDTGSARETGRVRAEQGVPLADTLHAYRIGSELLWTEILLEARKRPEVSDDLLVSESAGVWALFGRYAEAVAAAYRERAAELTSHVRARRSALAQALFTGVVTDRTLWEAARELGLPEHGPYAVAVAEGGAAGGEPPEGERGERGARDALLQARLPFVREALAGQHVALIALPGAAAEDTCLRILRRTGARVGLSPCFPSLRDTPQALRFARRALSVLEGTGPGVVRFDDDPLAMVVSAAAPEAAHLVEVVLRPVLGLPTAERSRLLRTLEHWFAAAGSAAGAARSLFVHPNTVRYRLRRVEELTGRSLSDPRATADIRAALLAVRPSGAGSGGPHGPSAPTAASPASGEG